MYGPGPATVNSVWTFKVVAITKDLCYQLWLLPTNLALFYDIMHTHPAELEIGNTG